MVESLKELNKICQKPNYKTVGNWMVRNILRDIALPITWLLLHTSITANQVTLISLIVGLLSIGLISFVSADLFLIGTIGFQIWYLLDHVDGQIARYRKTDGLTGRFFDFLMHHLIHTVIFFALGIHMMMVTEQFFYVLWGFGLSMMILAFNLTHDAKSKAFIEKMLGCDTIHIQRSHASGNSETLSESRPLLKEVFKWVHKLCEIHVLMNILTAVAILELWAHFPSRTLLFFLYSVLVPVLSIGKIFYIITNQKFDQEFNDHFKVE